MPSYRYLSVPSILRNVHLSSDVAKLIPAEACFLSGCRNDPVLLIGAGTLAGDDHTQDCRGAAPLGRERARAQQAVLTVITDRRQDARREEDGRSALAAAVPGIQIPSAHSVSGQAAESGAQFNSGIFLGLSGAAIIGSIQEFVDQLWRGRRRKSTHPSIKPTSVEGPEAQTATDSEDSGTREEDPGTSAGA